MGLGHLWRKFFRAAGLGVKASAVSYTEWEYKELENIFGLLTLGNAAGIPGPPSLLSLDLLPFMERELLVLQSRARVAEDPWGELFSTFDVT